MIDYFINLIIYHFITDYVSYRLFNKDLKIIFKSILYFIISSNFQKS